MGKENWLDRLWQRAAAGWYSLRALLGLEGKTPGYRNRDLHTTVTFRALVDAVIPETPELEAELGTEQVPGGLAIELDEFLVTYVDEMFQFGLPHLGAQGNLPLSDAVAHVLDAAALELLDRNENEAEPDGARAVELLDPHDVPAKRSRDAAGAFARLARDDRLRAVGVLDAVEFEVSPTADELYELDVGLVGQLVVGFTELIYYSEWEGYDDYDRPPSEREHPNDPAAVQGWRQTGFPGYAPGYAALRGYVGIDDGPLGDGETWTTIDDEAASPVQVMRDSGSFRENDYDTSDYEDPYQEVA